MSGVYKQLLDYIQNTQGRGKSYNPYQDLDYSGYHKTKSNNCFIIHRTKKEMSRQ